VQYVVPVGEDTDTQEYEIKNGEEMRVSNWGGDQKPECTYVMKDGDNLAEYLASAPVSDTSDK
jgi:hypothetical protein